MAASRIKPNRTNLIATVGVTVMIAALTNGALAAFGLNARNAQHWPSFAPQGPVIGIVWIVLFALMGAGLWLARSKRAVAGLILLCLAYPFYTHALGGHLCELTGNLVTLAYAVWLALRVRTQSVTAALLIGVVGAWVVFATALVIGLIRLNGWST